MSNLVPEDEIEVIVGHARDEFEHWGRMVPDGETEGGTFYILHSRRCKESGIDLRLCEFSLALDQGFDPADFADHGHNPVRLQLWHGMLQPAVNEDDSPTGATVVGPIRPDRA